jgi:hypothetical protein
MSGSDRANSTDSASGTPAALQDRFGGTSLEETFVQVLGDQEGLA